MMIIIIIIIIIILIFFFILKIILNRIPCMEAKFSTYLSDSFNFSHFIYIYIYTHNHICVYLYVCAYMSINFPCNLCIMNVLPFTIEYETRNSNSSCKYALLAVLYDMR